MSVKECTGVCCRRFTLPFRPESLLQFYKTTTLVSRGGFDTNNWNEDIVFWYPYLVYLGPAEKHGSGFWTCKLLDDTSGLCKLYEHRPTACRGYPYSMPCEHCGGSEVTP